MRRSWFVLALLVPAGVILRVAYGQTPRLTDETYESVKQFVSLRPTDLNFQRVDWHDNIFDGLVQAQREDKPLVLWMYFGDPRSGC